MRHFWRAKLFHPDRLAQAAASLDHQLPARSVHAHLLVADLPKQVSARARLGRQGQRQLVLRQPRLVRAPQRRFRAEVAIRRHKASDPLVRTEEVVVRDEVADAQARVRQVLQLDPLQEFALDRLPKPLALAHGFWVVRARHRVVDALFCQQVLEVGFSSPREVLPALVGQDFARLAKARDPVE